MDKLPPLSKPKKKTIADLPPLTPSPVYKRSPKKQQVPKKLKKTTIADLPPLTPSPVYKRSPKKQQVPKKLKKTTIADLPPLTPSPVRTERRDKKQLLSGNKDVDLIILSELDDKSLFSFCQSFESKNRYINKLCSNEIFWKNRFIKKYGPAEKNPDRTWKRFYLKVSYYDDNFKDENRIEETRKEISKEKSDIINFFSNYLGMKALRKLLDNLDKIKEFEIYTGFKGTPVTWNYSYKKYEDFFRSYPDFPGKPKISHPITGEEYREFAISLQKYFNVKFADDILTIEKKGDKFELTAESMSEEELDNGGLLLTKKELLDLINETVKFYRVNIIDSVNNYQFDLREYLAFDSPEDYE